MKNSKIGWTDHTWNPWQGCHKVSAGCKHCYIGPIMRRSKKEHEPFKGPIRTGPATWRNAAAWNRQAARENRRFRVFTCSMSDFFHAQADRWRREAWEVIQACDRLDFLILTKRPQRIAAHLPADWGNGYRNVWLGTTVESSKYLKRIDALADVPAARHFISAEPLFGAINFRPYLSKIDWIITGCEKAHKDKRRQMDLDWVRSIRDQCGDAGVAHFFKQYYVGNQVQTDGLLDGEVCQEWPSAALT